MSWYAAVFGELRFASAAKLATWRKRTCDSADWDDWIGEFEHDQRGAAKVGDVIDALDSVAIDRAKVTVRIDQLHEDGFRDDAAQLAAAFRIAERDGATGDVYFIGGYGAMGDFAYHLHVGEGTSTIREVPKKQRPAIYELANAAKLFDVPKAPGLEHPTIDFDEFSQATDVPPRMLKQTFDLIVMHARGAPIDPRWGEPAIRAATTNPTEWSALLVAALAQHPQAFETIRARCATAPSVGAICQAFVFLRDPRAIPIIQALPATPFEKKHLVKEAADKLRRWAKQAERRARPAPAKRRAKPKPSRRARS